jgi:hypothetical protein
VRAGGIGDIDFTVVAGEAKRVPFLLLPAIFSAPGRADDVARNIIGEPFGDLAQFLHRADIGFLVELAKRGLIWVFVLIDAALRHLPDMRRVDMLGAARSPADEYEAGAVEHHDAGAGTIGQGFEGGHSHSANPVAHPISVYPRSAIYFA